MEVFENSVDVALGAMVSRRGADGWMVGLHELSVFPSLMIPFNHSMSQTFSRKSGDLPHKGTGHGTVADASFCHMYY